MTDVSKVQIVLKKTSDMGKVWYVFTAYPVP